MSDRPEPIDPHQARTQIDQRQRAIMNDALAAMRDQIAADYTWQRFARGLSKRPAYDEVSDRIEALAEQFKEACIEHLTESFIADSGGL